MISQSYRVYVLIKYCFITQKKGKNSNFHVHFFHDQASAYSVVYDSRFCVGVVCINCVCNEGVNLSCCEVSK